MRKNITRETTITLLLLPRIINSHTSYKFIPNWQNGNFVNFLYVVLHIICSHSETFKLQCLEKKTDIVVDSTRLKSYVTINSDAFSYINSNQLWLPALNISYVTAHTHACTHARTHAHTHTHTTILQPFVWYYPFKPVPEETFTRLHLSSSSTILYQLPPSTMIHSILLDSLIAQPLSKCTLVYLLA